MSLPDAVVPLQAGPAPPHAPSPEPEWPRALLVDVSVLSPAASRPGFHLVTRPTGRKVRAAIRAAIEDGLAGAGGAPVVIVVDLTRITILDFSCADEVVAKLLVRHLDQDRPRDAFFLFRALEVNHRRAFEEVLQRHGLAAACDLGGGRCRLLGRASRDELRAWDELERRGAIPPGELASLDGDEGRRALGGLATRRLSFSREDGTALALSAIAARRARQRQSPTRSAPQ